MTVSNREVKMLQNVGKKVANGGNIIFAFCYTGKDKSGERTGRLLSQLYGGNKNVFLPIGYAKTVYNVYTTGKAVNVNHSLNGPGNPGWLKASGANITRVRDIVLSYSAKEPVKVVTSSK